MHKFNRHKVPLTQKPPKNHSELIKKAHMLCDDCGESLLELSKRVYTCKTCSGDFDQGDIVYFCLKCKEKGTHEHKLEKMKGNPGLPAGLASKDKGKLTEEERKEYLDSLLDDYYKMEFEDIIGGGTIKTRFNYRKVESEDFGLTEDEILLLEEKQLNRLVSLKNYRPYLDQ
jgi:hypothetical protein